MSLLDDAKQESAKTNRPVCTLSLLDPDLLAEIDEALDTPGVSAVGLERALAKRGVTVEGRSLKATTLGRHRRRDCTCDPR